MSDLQPIRTFDRRTVLIGAAVFVAGACTGSDDEAPETTGETITQTADLDNEDSSGQTDGADTGSAEASDSNDAEDGGAGLAISRLTVEQFSALAICAIAPSTTAGPFPTIDPLDRQDVTEGYPGHPLRLGVRVVDETCQPVPGARVEIWHADATGDYSAYTDDGSGKDEGEGTTFLRGIQTANQDGILEFQTIYPGWYEGRAVHIHIRATLDGEEVLTSQLYFDEAYTEDVYSSGEYAQFGPPDTGWDDDSLIGDPKTDGSGISLVAAETSLGQGTLGLINLGVSV